MKLGNKTIWLTGNEFVPGPVLNEIETENVYNHIQAKIYYQEGISEIENEFRPSNYIDKGYVCTLIAHKDAISIIFIKYKGADPVDMGIAYIDRSKIIDFEENPSTDLIVVKKEEGKHSQKNFGRKAFAGASVLISAVSDQFVSVNTHQVNGVKYKLYYQSKFGEKEHLTLYSSDEYKNDVTLFLNTYYKKDLPEEAQKPIEQEKSNCFIATACYRDMFSEEVIFFRWYRDNKLQKTLLGRFFIKTYYRISPYFYKVLFNNPKASNKIKVILDKLFLKLK
jgi:hypothetical protein